MGNAGHDQPDQNVSVEGRVVLDNVDTLAGFYCESNVTVNVTDGLLTVDCGRPEGGANTTINWLDYIPVDTQTDSRGLSTRCACPAWAGAADGFVLRI